MFQGNVLSRHKLAPGRRAGRFHLLRLCVALLVALVAVPALGLGTAIADKGGTPHHAESAATVEPSVESTDAEEPVVETADQPGTQGGDSDAPSVDEPADVEEPAEEVEAAPRKVVVCKYVRTPEQREVFSHIVIVAEPALPDWDGVFPGEFADAHGRSVAVRYAADGEQAHDVPATDCPVVEEPPGEEPPGEEPPADEQKVVVCKYVTTPGDGELLSHIVIVDESALGDGFDGTFPFAFADAHFSSIAIRWAEDGEQAHDIPLTACPGVPTTTMVIKKVDFEDESLGLANATFELYRDNQPYADPAAPVVGGEDVLIGSDQTDTEGLAKFAELQQGHYLVVETIAPEGYELPAADTMVVVIDDGNFIEGGEMAPILFRDFALGQLAIVAKRQFELIDGAWVESDGVADFGDVVKYVVTVRATGPKIFHDVVVSDYVPGFNPADTTSTLQASLEPGSAVCTGSLVCEVSAENGLVTWKAGTVHDAEGSVEMVVRFPEAPDNPTFDADGVYTATLWNVGYLEWDEVVGGTPAPRMSTAAVAFDFEHHERTSNEVQLSASITQEPGGPGNPDDPGTPELPNTGSPAFLAQLAALGGVLVGLGLLMAGLGRRRGGAAN